jgi:hypothetical protein
MSHRLTLIAVLVLATATAADGRGIEAPLQPHFERVTIPEDEHVAAKARCERRTDAVSGGFAAPDNAYAGGGPYTDILGASRQGGREFAVRAQNFSSAKGTLVSYVYCADLGPITIAQAERTIADRRDGVATARCPRGSSAISGGWTGETIGGGRPQMIPFLSKRAGTRGWKVGAENGAFRGSAKLIVHAYCAETAPARVAVTDRPFPALGMHTAGASCDAGEEAVAGGFDAATPRGFSAGASVSTSRRKRGGLRWKVVATNGGRDRHLAVYAYCI